MNPGNVIDDYLADLIPTPTEAKAAEPAAAAPAPVAIEPPPFKPVVTQGGSEHISDDEFEALLDELHGPAGAPGGPLPAPVAEPVAMVPAEVAPAPPAKKEEISEDEFEALLDELHGKGAPPTPPLPAVVAADQVASSPYAMKAGSPVGEGGVERRRRAADRITTWLRFALGEQNFAVEVLKVQEVLRVPEILPLRGAAKAMMGLMNLRGQIIPVLDLAIRLGLPKQVPTEASRVIVLEENGDTLGLLVRSVADVLALSDAAVEHLNGPLAMEGVDVTCGIARRERSVTVLLDAKRLLG